MSVLDIYCEGADDPFNALRYLLVESMIPYAIAGIFEELERKMCRELVELIAHEMVCRAVTIWNLHDHA